MWLSQAWESQKYGKANEKPIATWGLRLQLKQSVKGWEKLGR